jgi:ATP-dependent Lon protease
MKESARAAISYIRSNADTYGIDSSAFETTDIHIHVPEGATPKDGPSAGITMATAILSAFTKKPVKRTVAMTGEITLRGKVLPIGGLKEKALAAYRIGIRDVIIPEDNKKDLEEIPESVREKLNFIPVSDADTVFRNAINGI